MAQVSTELPDEMAQALGRMAAVRGLPAGDIAAEALALLAANEDEIEHRVEQGRADIAEGRFVEHEQVAGWLLSWGIGRELPPPRCG